MKKQPVVGAIVEVKRTWPEEITFTAIVRDLLSVQFTCEEPNGGTHFVFYSDDWKVVDADPTTK